MADSVLNDIINTSLQRIKDLAHTETVIGDPISLPGGTTILPVSKISLGFASGGLDFNGKQSDAHTPTAAKFGGGGGTGMTVTPVAFLTVSPSGTVELLPIVSPSDCDTLDKVTTLAEKTPDILRKIKQVFARKKNSEPDEEQENKPD